MREFYQLHIGIYLNLIVKKPSKRNSSFLVHFIMKWCNPASPSSNEYNETSIISIRSIDFLDSEQRFNSLFSIQCSNYQIKLIKDLKSLFTDLYNNSGQLSSRLSLADIASFDRATSGLLMQREEHHSPDANNSEVLNYLRYFSIRYFDNQPTSAAKPSARILMTKHIVTTAWQAKVRVGYLAINQQIGLQTIINSHKQYTTVQRMKML